MLSLHDAGERVCGPYEWDEAGKGHQLRHYETGWWAYRHWPDGWAAHYAIGDHVALCLRERQVDDWMVEQDIYIACFHGLLHVARGDGKGLVLHMNGQDWTWVDGLGETMPTRNAARIAALDAVEKEKART